MILRERACLLVTITCTWVETPHYPIWLPLRTSYHSDGT